jgi:DMSO/TMAO reductase YedYZ molybdopterin-dependent catalytic subunit
VITSRILGARGKQRAAKLGIEPERLPPGQTPTEKWPVLTVGPTQHVPLDQWSFAIHGAVEAPFALRWDEAQALEQVTFTRDVHCVTRWSRFDMVWEGAQVRPLLERARPTATATHALVHAFGGYTTNLPLDDLLRDDVLLAFRAGPPWSGSSGSPSARLLVPHLYLWKSAKWVRAIEVLEADRAGFWEANGYHHRGDPFAEERFGPATDPRTMTRVRRERREAGPEGVAE